LVGTESTQKVIRLVDEMTLEFEDEKDVRLILVQVVDPDTDDPVMVAKQLENSSDVISAHVEVEQIHDPVNLVVHDPLYTRMWHLDRIKMKEAWEKMNGTGKREVVVAVIDTGFDLQHEDLYSQYVAQAHRFNAADPTHKHEPVPDPDLDEKYYHGTLCAGVVGASFSTWGVVGVAPGCSIMPIRISFRLGEWHLLKAIRWAWDRGAKVMSMSWAWDVPNVEQTRLYGLLTQAYKSGVVLVAASGNHADESGYTLGDILFPASHKYVIAVGASTEDDKRCAFSAYGPALDVVAPGTGIWTTDFTGRAGKNPGGSTARGDTNGRYYKDFEGTSAAAPQVAGLAALMLSIKPDLKPKTVRQLIQVSAAGRSPGMKDPEIGFGRIDAADAIRRVLALDLS
jgi:subtilisin family serine protease